jgi:hypothetical protein
MDEEKGLVVAIRYTEDGQLVDAGTGEVLGYSDPGRAINTEMLTKEFPESAIKSREGGGGKTFRYVSTDTVIRRLNEATANRWSFEIVSQSFLPGGVRINRYAREGGPKEIRQQIHLVHGRLTIPGLGSRDGYGVQRLDDPVTNTDDLLKAAPGDALKRAAVSFGVAIDLYGKDLEHEPPTEAAVTPARTPAAAPARAPQRQSAPPAASEPTDRPTYPYDRSVFANTTTTADVIGYMKQSDIKVSGYEGREPNMADAIYAANRYGKSNHGVEKIVIGTGDVETYKGVTAPKVRPMDIGNALAHWFKVEQEKDRESAPDGSTTAEQDAEDEEVPF